MAQNFLYMFEFVVDDLLVTRPNYCAPEEYPTCCEVTFRNSVFLSINDQEFGKRCIFSLDTPIADSDKLLIHVYKKKTEKCKFLVGFTDVPIKGLFDKVLESFNTKNPDWQDKQAKRVQTMPNSSESEEPKAVIDNDLDCESEGRQEELCHASELTKKLLSLFNLKGSQTGNIVLIIRLVAIGPVLTYPFPRMCNVGCEKDLPSRNSKPYAVGGPQDICVLSGVDSALRTSGERSTDGCSGCDTGDESTFDKASTSKCTGNNHFKSSQAQNNCCIPLRDHCLKEVKKPVCQRYFACNADPCDLAEDECGRSTKRNAQRQNMASCGAPNPCGGNQSSFSQPQSCDCKECMTGCEDVKYQCDTCKSDLLLADSYDGIQPCFRTTRRPDVGPEAYDEFEACLNGSGLVIRVLKDTHRVENICDGTEEFNEDNTSQFDRNCEKENYQTSQCGLTNILQRSNFARNHIKRRTGGHIINHPDLPKIRANIKYSGNDNCYPENYHVPYSKIKTHCDKQRRKLENYRSQRSKASYDEYDPVCTAKHRKDERNCCVQVNREDIRNIMKGLDVDTRKKGIEVCYKTCEDTDSDVFLVKLGSKKKCERKKNNIEIELKTPKQPLVLPKQHVTTETQITESELDAALSDVCKKKRGKGKNKKKK